MKQETVTAKVELITPELAAEYLKFNKINRRLNKYQIDYYARQMQNGQWRLNGEAICFAKGGAMVNGQHRLQAIIQSGVAVKTLVVRNCDNDSFVTYDSGKNRSVADSFDLSDIKNYSGISAIVGNYIKLRLGMNNMEDGSELRRGNRKSKQELLDEYYSSEELYQTAFKIAQKCCKKYRLFNISVVGGLFVYLVKDKKHPEMFVESFFKMLFYNENVTNKTINVLRDKILQDKLTNSRMTPKYKHAILIKTWNAYVANKELKVLKVDVDKGPNELWFV